MSTIQWVSGALSVEVKRPGREPDNLHVEPGLRMGVTIIYHFQKRMDKCAVASNVS